MGRTANRATLIVLQSFVAFTTMFGAFLVVPSLPLDWLQRGPMTDYTIPAIALGLVGVSAIVSVVLLVLGSTHAPVVTMISGAMMIAFEFVEIAVVGFSVIVHGADNPVSWLQVVYIAIGVVVMALAYRLWHQMADPWSVAWHAR
jgi:hypothetical protein